MRLLTKFWMQTPVGELEFSRKEPLTWEMLPTKEGLYVRTTKMSRNNSTSRDVVTAFGWPTHFAPYGEIHEEVPNEAEVKPSSTPVEVVRVLKHGSKIYVVLPDGSHEIYVRQQ